ncbi:lysosomal acid phosphatase-like [Phymastichus coffea]|uniref:lysosomal acid phosphatase-like n=1 Tax=Phymastichus coffea TaxID=108790 RepID=UPI00273C2EB3|nr:lysosomal acid phosphatase-like [Phymastichus coffea]
MIHKYIFLYCLYFTLTQRTLLAKIVPNDRDLKLELVQLLFRHGARTPLSEELEVFNYLNSSVYDDVGLGILTPKGKQQEYEFGTFLRKRYDGYLRANYLSEEVYAYTTHNDRTKMSLELILAGLYPPTDAGVWNPQLKWSPIPYRYVPEAMDVLLKYYEGPRFLHLIKKTQRSDEFKTQISKHAEFLNFLTNKTGIQFDKKIKNIQDMYGVLVSNENLNLTLPEWYTPEMKQKFIKTLEVVFDSYSFTQEMKKLHSGPLIKTMIENMNLNKTFSNPRKIYLYSGHDGNVAAFIRAHNIQEFRYTRFGDGLVFEKFRDSRDKVYVRLLAWTSEKKKLTPLKLGSHKEFCPIKDYLKLVESLVPTDQEIDQLLAEVDMKQLKDLFFKDDAVKLVN